MGFDITWFDVYSDAVNSLDDYSGFFKVGNPNIMVLSELEMPTDLDLSGQDAFSLVFTTTEQLRIANTSINNILTPPLTELSANNTQYKKVPQMQDDSTLRMDGNNLNQSQVDAVVNSMLLYSDDEIPVPIGARPNMILENESNAVADPTNAAFIEGDGGKVWQNNVGLLSLQTNADSPTSFVMHMKGAAKCDWALDNTIVATDINNHNFVFTDDSIKTIGIRGDNVAEADYILLSGKSLIGTFDMSPMLTAAFRIDFSDNPNLNELILPQTDGEFDRLDGHNSGITSLRLDKLPGLINKKNVRITLTDCPNLDTDSVALNILAVDLANVNGRKLFLSGIPPLSVELQTQLQSNGWTIT